MTRRRSASQIAKLHVLKSLRVFTFAIVFFVALDACIAVNRWWTEGGFQAYIGNLVVMVGGFTLCIILVSKSKSEFVGYVIFFIAIYFICNYEIAGPSKFYLTPFDPIFDRKPVFIGGSTWLGLTSLVYRKGMAYCMSILAASILAASKLKGQSLVELFRGRFQKSVDET